MADKTGISWTDSTWNPVRGCSRISAGCQHCYAEQQAARIVRMGKGAPTAYDGLVKLTAAGEPRWTGEVRLVPDALALPLRWSKPRRIFVNSMSDLFHESLTNEQIAAVFGVMAAANHHTYQVLTKRARRMREWFETQDIHELVEKFRQIALAGRIEEHFTDERTMPIAGWDGYLITSRGRVLSTSGNDTCQWCSEPNVGDLRKKFCSTNCKSKAHYEQQQGRWTPPAPSAKEMRPMPGDAGHARVMLYRDGDQQRFLVHRLVLDAFDRPGREDEQACHIDGDPTNNALWNLRWGTQSQNWDDSKRHGTRRRHSKLTGEQVDEIRRLGAQGVSGAEIGRRVGISDTQARSIIAGEQWLPEYKPEWPLRSVWLGVSVENQAAADERIPELLRTPAAVRFLSCEPLLGPVDLLHTPRAGEHHDYLTGERMTALVKDSTPRIDWVIAGCESGPGARPCSVEWLRSLRDQCASASVSFFLKQAVEDIGDADRVCGRNSSSRPCGERIRYFAYGPGSLSVSCGCAAEGAEDANGTLPVVVGEGSRRKPGGVIELPYLDGVQHAAMPEVRRG